MVNSLKDLILSFSGPYHNQPYFHADRNATHLETTGYGTHLGLPKKMYGSLLSLNNTAKDLANEGQPFSEFLCSDKLKDHHREVIEINNITFTTTRGGVGTDSTIQKPAFLGLLL